MKKRLVGILLSFALMMAIVPVLSTPADAINPTHYPIRVGNVPVTSDNMNDVLSDGTVSYTPEDGNTPAVLTLKGANINGASEPYIATIYATQDLVIDATTASTVIAPENVKEICSAIHVQGNLTLKGTLTADGGGVGISCDEGDITIDGKVTAHGDDNGFLMVDPRDIIINSGAEVTATGDNVAGIGIATTQGSVIIKDGARLTAVGGEYGAIDGVVKNEITGTGWTNKEGTAGEASIEANINKDLNDPKKVQFPAKQYTISYDLDGGMLDGQTGTVTKKVDACTDITLPAPTKDGCTFDYWEGSKYNAGDKYTVTGDHTFKAVWKTADPGNDDQNSTDGSDDSSSGKSSSGKKGVKTGDENSLSAWIVLLLAALTGTAGMVFARKRR